MLLKTKLAKKSLPPAKITAEKLKRKLNNNLLASNQTANTSWLPKKKPTLALYICLDPTMLLLFFYVQSSSSSLSSSSVLPAALRAFKHSISLAFLSS
ncbi:hypothetical protein LguiB_012724 [Lonicera macranthoides]